MQGTRDTGEIMLLVPDADQAKATPVISGHTPALVAPPGPAGVEASPWSRLLYDSSVGVLANGVNLGRLPDLWSIHAYGDPATAPKDWDPLEDPCDGNGWRWELNAISTCREAIEAAVGVRPRPVVVTEFNTAAAAPRHRSTTCARGSWPPWSPHRESSASACRSPTLPH